ncbi:MAG: hypothetical protein M1548_01975 [Actinobacteria bacterium]|nr:hypothetical protein [Actinomycetota bacterium]
MSTAIARLVELHEPVAVSPADQASTDAYADVAGSKIDHISAKYVGYTCKNTHGANAIKWKVLASFDDVTYVEVQAEAVLAAGTVGAFAASSAQLPYRYFKVQVASNVAGNAGTAQVRGRAKA